MENDKTTWETETFPEEVVEGRLLCPHCRGELSCAMVLDNTSVSWPNNNWVFTMCPLCQMYFHTRIADNEIETGQLDGAPGPCFFCCSAKHVEDLLVDNEEDRLLCKFGEAYYEFPAKWTINKAKNK